MSDEVIWSVIMTIIVITFSFFVGYQTGYTCGHFAGLVDQKELSPKHVQAN